MQGPYPPGTHSPSWAPTNWEKARLVRGRRYRIVKAFVDADGDPHQEGEEWSFVASAFSRQDDELMVCVRRSDMAEWRILLFWRPEAQQEIIENFCQYVRPVSDVSA